MVCTPCCQSERCRHNTDITKSEHQAQRATIQVCALRHYPHSGLRAPIPDVTGGEPHLEAVLLDVEARVLVQRSEVPEHAHVLEPKKAVLLHVQLQDSGHDFQMKALRVRMTSGSGRPFSRTQREEFENSEAGTLGKKNAHNSEADFTEGKRSTGNVKQYASVAGQFNPEFGTARASELCVLA